MKPQLLDSFTEVGAILHADTAYSLFLQTILQGALAFSTTPSIQVEIQAISKKIADSEDDLPAAIFAAVAPQIFADWVNPISELLGGCNATMGKIPLSPDKPKSRLSTLHTDSNNRHGITILAPISGPDAELYHGSSSLEFPAPGLSSVVYGVGKAVSLRQGMRTVDTQGVEQSYPQRYHDGYCTAGPREVLSIDMHTDGSTIVLQEQL